MTVVLQMAVSIGSYGVLASSGYCDRYCSDCCVTDGCEHSYPRGTAICTAVTVVLQMAIMLDLFAFFPLLL